MNYNKYIMLKNKYVGLVIQLLVIIGFMAMSVKAQTSNGDGETNALATTLSGVKVNSDVSKSAILNEVISLKVEDVDLLEALNLIADPVNLKVAYNNESVAEHLKKDVSFNLNQVTIHDALWIALEGTNLRYAISPNRNLVLFNKTNESPVNKYILQEIVQGTVVEAGTGDPLPGVNIVLKGTTTGTSTDEQGNYSLELEELEGVLVFSFVGFETQEVQIDGRSEINISLQPRAFQAEEIVVSGYQVQSRANVTGAISVADVEAIRNQPVTNPIRSLQGRVAGLYISTDGDPAGDAEVRIRGVSTLNNNDPLYIIDGIPTNENAFNILNPNSIEDIQVLKDAASSAIYGSRASNGVVLITTKRSEKNEFSVNYNSQVTFSQFHTVPNVLNTVQRESVYFKAFTSDGGDPEEIPDIDYDYTQNSDGSYTINEVIIPEFIAPGVRSADTNWFDVVSRPGVIQDHNFSISSGGDNGGTTLSLRYFKNQYILKEKDVQKVSASINSFQEFGKDGNITIGESLTLSTRQNDGFENSVLGGALTTRTIIPVFEEDGSFAGPPNGNFNNGDNPLRVLTHNRWDRVRDFNLFGKISTNINLSENFTINSNFGVDWANNKSRDINRRFQVGFQSRDINNVVKAKSDDISYTANATVNYQYNDINHDVTLLGGSEFTTNSFETNFTRREDFAIETPDFFVEDAGSGNQFVGGTATGFTLLSFFGKADYVFNSRYIASVTVRHDGSSKFSENNRFGTFPSATLAWRMDQEDFFSNAFPFLTTFKVRGGYGVTGNQRIANDARFGLFDISSSSEDRLIAPWQRNNSYANYVTSYGIDGNDTGSLPSGFRRIQIENDELKWETTKEYNVGIDFSIKEEKVFGSVEYFNRDTEDILIQPDFIAVLGEGGNRFVNGASVNVKGFEVTTTYRGNAGPVRFSLTGNIGHYQDKITELPDDVVDSFPGNSEKTILGESINSLFGFVADGLFQDQQEVDNHAEQPGAAPGRIRYADLNGDGVINNLDQQYLGSSSANYEYGFAVRAEYKGFDLSMFLQGVSGREVFEWDRTRTDFTSLWAGTNYSTRILDAWTPENRDTEIPKLTLQDNNDESRNSSYFVADGSYVKLRQLSVGYTFTNLPISKGLRLYVTGENLVTIKDSSFKGPDPERPEDAFPIPRNITLGVNLSF